MNCDIEIVHNKAIHFTMNLKGRKRVLLMLTNRSDRIEEKLINFLS